MVKPRRLLKVRRCSPTHPPLFHSITVDPFLADEPNPNLTNALDSSLWELYSHKNHYHAGVSTLARIFEEAFTKPSYPMEDFLDHTYATVRLWIYTGTHQS
jgi:hypothetical protein